MRYEHYPRRIEALLKRHREPLNLFTVDGIPERNCMETLGRLPITDQFTASDIHGFAGQVVLVFSQEPEYFSAQVLSENPVT